MMKNIVKVFVVFILVLASGCTNSVDEEDFIFRPKILFNQEYINIKIKLQNQSEKELDDVTIKFYLFNIESEEIILVKQYDGVDFKSSELKYFEFDITSLKDEYNIKNEQILNDEYVIEFEIIV